MAARAPQKAQLFEVLRKEPEVGLRRRRALPHLRGRTLGRTHKCERGTLGGLAGGHNQVPRAGLGISNVKRSEADDQGARNGARIAKAIGWVHYFRRDPLRVEYTQTGQTKLGGPHALAI